jgi:hypothetical protein
MKKSKALKLSLILAAAGTQVACNNEGTSEAVDQNNSLDPVELSVSQVDTNESETKSQVFECIQSSKYADARITPEEIENVEQILEEFTNLSLESKKLFLKYKYKDNLSLDIALSHAKSQEVINNLNEEEKSVAENYINNGYPPTFALRQVMDQKTIDNDLNEDQKAIAEKYINQNQFPSFALKKACEKRKEFTSSTLNPDKEKIYNIEKEFDKLIGPRLKAEAENLIKKLEITVEKEEEPGLFILRNMKSLNHFIKLIENTGEDITDLRKQLTSLHAAWLLKS